MASGEWILMPLKKQLNQIIKERGQITLDDLASLCKNLGYKTATAERSLRPSLSPEIEGVWNKKGTAIIGYRYKGIEKYNTAKSCCASSVIFGIHDSECQVNTQPKGLF